MSPPIIPLILGYAVQPMSGLPTHWPESSSLAMRRNVTRPVLFTSLRGGSSVAEAGGQGQATALTHSWLVAISLSCSTPLWCLSAVWSTSVQPPCRCDEITLFSNFYMSLLSLSYWFVVIFFLWQAVLEHLITISWGLKIQV